MDTFIEMEIPSTGSIEWIITKYLWWFYVDMAIGMREEGMMREEEMIYKDINQISLTPREILFSTR